MCIWPHDSSPPAPRRLSRWLQAVREGWWDGTRLPRFPVPRAACYRDIGALDLVDACFWRAARAGECA